jgi:hypothetical protein
MGGQHVDELEEDNVKNKLKIAKDQVSEPCKFFNLEPALPPNIIAVSAFLIAMHHPVVALLLFRATKMLSKVTVPELPS